MKFRMMAEQCDTCIFRPGNLMYLRAGRLRDMVQECRRRDTHVICHETLGSATGDDETEAACRGYFDAGNTSQLYRIAGRLGIIEEVRPDQGQSSSRGS